MDKKRNFKGAMVEESFKLESLIIETVEKYLKGIEDKNEDHLKIIQFALSLASHLLIKGKSKNIDQYRKYKWKLTSDIDELYSSYTGDGIIIEKCFNDV